MDADPWLAVTNGQALRFFFEHLRDVTDDDAARLSPNCSTTRVCSRTSRPRPRRAVIFRRRPTSLTTVFDVFVLDRSQHVDPEIMEAAASQCLLLTGFFGAQLRRRHNLDWYATLGASFYDQAAHVGRDRSARDDDAHDGRAVHLLAPPAGPPGEGTARPAIPAMIAGDVCRSGHLGNLVLPVRRRRVRRVVRSADGHARAG